MVPFIYLYTHMTKEEMISTIRSSFTLPPGKKILIGSIDTLLGLVHVVLLCAAYGKENIVCVHTPHMGTKHPAALKEIKSRYCSSLITVPITMAVWEVIKELRHAGEDVYSRTQFELLESHLHEAVVDVIMDGGFETSHYTYPPIIEYDDDNAGSDAIEYARIVGIPDDIVMSYID